MSDLSVLFNPQNIVIVGASNRPLSPGRVIIQNLLNSNFNGTLLPLNRKYKSISGILCYPDTDSLPVKPDLAILCVDPDKPQSLFQQLSDMGTRVVVLLANKLYDPGYYNLLHQLAIDHDIRLLGPNSLGIIMPWAELNASLSPVLVNPGKIAFVSQSAAITTTVLDWAKDKEIGFSSVISIGSMADVSVAEIIDYLVMHSKTEAILLYIEHVKDARRFMSAARAAARNKRVLVLKGARSDVGKELSMMHLGGQKSANIVYDAAFKRCGLLQVHSSHELFAAAETLTHSIPLRGPRLAIMTNGAGPAVLASDVLDRLGGKLAQLTNETKTKLEAISKECGSNPIDLSGDTQSNRFIAAFEVLMDDSSVNAILLMFSPSAISDSLATAQHILTIYQNHPNRQKINLLTNWLGDSSTQQARRVFTKAGIPTYRTPESSITAYMHLVRYRASQIQLMETPHSIEHTNHGSLLSDSFDTPEETRTQRLLQHYHIKHSPDETRGLQLSLCLKCDPTFGPVIFLGRGETISDFSHEAGFPPLNQKLAQSLIKSSVKLNKLPFLTEARYRELTILLVRFSQLIVDQAHIDNIELSVGFDADEEAVVTEIRVHPTGVERAALAISPFPNELEQQVRLKDDSKAVLRPIRPEDEPRHAEFLQQVSREDLYKRFFSDVGEFDHQALAHLTQIDYDREMALVLVQDDAIIGVVRAISDIRTNSAEFAVLIRSDKKGKGLGGLLMRAIIDYCRNKRLYQLHGITMPSNKGMVTLAKRLGFEIEMDFEEGVAEMRLIM